MSEIAIATGHLDALAERIAAKLAASPAPMGQPVDLNSFAALLAAKLREESVSTESARGAGAAVESSMTLGQFFRHYIDSYASVHTRSTKYFEQTYRLYLSPWSDEKLMQITRARVIELQSDLAKRKSKDVANNALELLSILYNKAIEWGLFSGINPVSRVKKFKEEPRERFLKADELPRFLAAVKSLRYQTASDLFLMLLFTAQRRRNVSEMRWQDIDFARRVWTIPRTKNGTSHQVPLVEEALEILERRRSGHDKHTEWVFPKRDGSGPVWSLDMAWRSVLQRAELDNLRIHDLRRSHASWQAINGTSTAIIGATLNHKDPKSTMIYARLYVDPIRDAMQRSVDRMLAPGQEQQLAGPHLNAIKKYPALKLVQRDTERPRRFSSGVPRNSSVKFSGEEQAVIESRIIRAVGSAPACKSRLHSALGGFKLNGIELQRILDEMVARGILYRFRGAPHWTVWQYSASAQLQAHL